MSDADRELRTDFTGDADILVTEAGRAEKAYKGVADETKGLARTMEASDDDVEAMGDALADALRQSDKAKDSLAKMREEVRRLQSGTSAAASEIPGDFHKMEAAADGTKQSFGETGKEAGSEFAQNLAEGLSSGNLGQVATDTAFGLLTAFQSVPIAGQVAIGLTAALTAAWTIVKGKSDQLKAEIAELFDTFIEEGADAVRKAVERSSLEKLGGDVATGWTKAAEMAGKLGIKTSDLVGMMDGDLVPAEQQLYDLMLLDYNTLLKKKTETGSLSTKEAERLQTIEDIMPLLHDQAEKYQTAAVASGIASDNMNKPVDLTSVDTYAQRLQDASVDAAATKKSIESIDLSKITGGAFQGSSGGQVRPNSTGKAAGAAGGPVPAPVVHQHWSITVNNMQADPNRTVAAIERWARDNGRPGSVTATAT